MCIATSDNHWWNDVLENGRSSPFATFFDIDWHPPKPELHEKILLPVLGEQYGRVLENQEISIDYEAGAFFACYGQSRYPIGPRTILPLLEPVVADLRRTHPDDHPDVLEIESIVTATKHLPTRWDTEPDKVRERMREKEIVKRRHRRARRRAAPPFATRWSGAWRDQRREGETRAASIGWRRCWPTRPTASASGASPPRRSTTAASSTSTTWPRSASRSRACSTPSTPRSSTCCAPGR